MTDAEKAYEWLDEKRSANSVKEYCKMREICFEALKKQIPKPMHFNPNETLDIKVCYECPICGAQYNRYYTGKKYCMECGQAILWEGKTW